MWFASTATAAPAQSRGAVRPIPTPVDPRDYILDIPGVHPPASTRADAAPGNPEKTSGPAGPTSGGGPWIAIYFKCCHAYARLYRNRAGTAYEGHCPKCGAKTRAAIGPGGTDQRFFSAE